MYETKTRRGRNNITDQMRSKNSIIKPAKKSSIIKSIKNNRILLSLSLNIELEILLQKFLKLIPNPPFISIDNTNYFNKIYTDIIA